MRTENETLERLSFLRVQRGALENYLRVKFESSSSRVTYMPSRTRRAT